MLWKKADGFGQEARSDGNSVSSWRLFETLGRRHTPCRSARALSDQGGSHTRSAQARQACCDVSRRMRGQLPVGHDGQQVEARPSLRGNQRKRRDTQTCNAFEASAAHTPGQGSGASVGSLRRKMRRRPGQLGLAVRASGERVQIAAVLLGGSDAHRTGPDGSNHLSCQPLLFSINPSTRRLHRLASGQRASSIVALELLIHYAPPGVTSTSPSFDPSGLGRARRNTSILMPFLNAEAPCLSHAILLRCKRHASPTTLSPMARPWVALPSLSALDFN